jgi:hypothetical protein
MTRASYGDPAFLVTADETFAAYAALGQLSNARRPRRTFRSGPTADVFSNGLPVATGNGVFAPRAGAAYVDVAEVTAGLDEIATTGLPYSLTCRASARATLEPLADARGLTLAEEMPVMVLDDLSTATLAAVRPELAVRRAGPDDYEDYLRQGARAFGVPYEWAAQFVPFELFADRSLRYWIGAVGDSAVIATDFVLGDWVAVFAVGTPPELRRRGYGTAITAQALRDGLESGARHAVLAATEAGYGVYTAMGFRTVERCPIWVSADADAPA